MEELFQSLSDFIQNNIEYAPFIIFGLLALAGFGVPVSEDVMLFISAVLATQNPNSLWPLFVGVCAGAYLSDLICYAFLGRYLGPRVFQIPFLSRLVPRKRMAKLESFYDKYGVATLLVGRFIPFGVRNALFFSAGLGKMNPITFALGDFLACMASCSFFFALYYHLGEAAIEQVRAGNTLIFALFGVGLAIFLLYKRFGK